ncbi:MAG: hypothetical protein QGH15_06335 [Kiritimatiellia bacterium]|jgi:hypothetical protein|nr:hypothetical protein [Kiritimatiellia bacterium]
MRACIVVVMLVAVAGCSTMQVDNSQKGWRLESSTVQIFVTENGGQVAPVYYCKDTDKPVQPYYLSPWQNEGVKDLPPILVPLRGDFFCMPFGGNSDAYKGEKHPPHGEVSSSKWRLLEQGKKGRITSLKLELETEVRKGKVTKTLSLVDGSNAIYSTHKLVGYEGSMPIAHHCILRLPEEEGAIKVTASRFELGRTSPTAFSDPKNREYQALAVDAVFTDLAKVPVMHRDTPDADCSSFPRRKGYSDLVQVFSKPAATPGWNAAVCQKEGYLWFCMRDTAVLPATLFWISNGGRQAPPWDGRNRCLGIEDSCSYFGGGLGPSVEANKINEAGFPTSVKLSPEKPTLVNYIQGVLQIPEGFGKVKDARFAPGKVTFVSLNGKEVTAPVQHEFLKTGKLE